MPLIIAGKKLFLEELSHDVSHSLCCPCYNGICPLWQRKGEHDIPDCFGYKTYWCFAHVLMMLHCSQYLDFLWTTKPKDLTVLFMYHEPLLPLLEQVWWYCSILDVEAEADITKSHTVWWQREGTGLRALGLPVGHLCLQTKTKQELVL